MPIASIPVLSTALHSDKERLEMRIVPLRECQAEVAAQRKGLALMRSPLNGSFMLVDTNTDTIVSCGASSFAYGLTLEEVEELLS